MSFSILMYFAYLIACCFRYPSLHNSFAFDAEEEHEIGPCFTYLFKTFAFRGGLEVNSQFFYESNFNVNLSSQSL